MWRAAGLPALSLAVAIGCGGRGELHGPGSTTGWDQPVVTSAFAPGAPFASPGERMVYRLSLHGLELATFTMVVGDLGQLDGRDVVVVHSGVQSSPLASMVRDVSDNFTAWIDVATARPVLFRADEQVSPDDPTRERTDAEVGELSDGSFPMRVRRIDRDDQVEAQVAGAAPLFDLNSFLMALRGWDVEVGTTATADVIRGRYLWRTQVTRGRFETVVTELGELPAIRIDGTSRRLRRDGTVDAAGGSRRYSLWISDDADRVPLRMIASGAYGEVRLEIVEYEPGAGVRVGE